MGKPSIKEVKALIKKWSSLPERVYLVVALVGVLGFALITPPFQGPDETSHYIRLQYIASGHVLPVDSIKTGASIPRSIGEVVVSTQLKDAGDGGLKKYNIRESYHAALKIPLNSGDNYQPPMISYSAIPYLPAVPAVVVSNSLGLSPVISLYAARVSLALFCVFITFFAIKLIPQKKYILAGIALIPMLLFQQSVVSIDGTSYSLLILFTALVMYLFKQPTISKKNWLILGGVCIAVTASKPLVFIFLPFILLLVAKKAAKIWIPAIAALCIAIFLGLSFYNAYRTESVVDPNIPSSVDSTAQTDIVKKDPKRFIRVMWNSYMTDYGDEEIQGIVGIFGAADTRYPLSMTFLYVIVLAYLMGVRFRPEDDVNIVPKAMKLLLLLLSAIYFILVNLALYISFSPVNFNIVYGVQGRYFLPILIILPLLITPFLTVTRRYRERSSVGVALALLFLVAAALFITLQRYYLYTP